MKSLAFAMLLATIAGCSKSSDKPAIQRDLAAERQELAERLTQSYKDAGVARIEGDVLVITAEQCAKPKLAAQVIELARRAGADLELADVRCVAPPTPATPPPPTKEEVVARFNEQFADIGAKARIEDPDILVLITSECEREARARELLRDAAALARKAGFRRVRCGASEDKLFELAPDDMDKAAGN